MYSVPAELLPEAAMFVVLYGAFALLGWYTGYWYHQPMIGLCAGLGTAGLIYGLTIEGIGEVILKSVVAFVLGVPFIYGLVVVTQVLLLAFGLISFSVHTFFVRSLLGALIGSSFFAAHGLTATGKFAQGYAGDGKLPEANMLYKVLLLALSLLTPVAFIIASTFVLPDHNVAAVIAFGTAWGIVAAAAPSFYTVLVERKTVRKGWLPIALIEYVLACFLLFAISDHRVLELVLPALVACGVTYGLVYLIATLLPAAAKIPGARLLEHLTSSKG